MLPPTTCQRCQKPYLFLHSSIQIQLLKLILSPEHLFLQQWKKNTRYGAANVNTYTSFALEWLTGVTTRSQIKVVSETPPAEFSCHNQEDKWGCDIVVTGDVNGGLIKVTLKENGQIVGCSRHSNWGGEVPARWSVKENYELIGCYLPGERKGFWCVC